MSKRIEFRVSPEIGFGEDSLDAFVSSQNIGEQFVSYRLAKRSVDARGKKVFVNLAIDFFEEGEDVEKELWSIDLLKDVSNSPEFIIVGAGPAGLFAALKCIELGLKPIVLERGKDVRDRRRDLAAINKEHRVNPDSNYCFGEGGAGTYSDGKLYTRSKKRGDVNRVLEILVSHGAKDDILVDAHPHIGTNKLPKIIASIRDQIISFGGEVRFNARVNDFILESEEIKGVKLVGNETLKGVGVLLATGHSARDVFELCRSRNVKIEAKPFALGVRVEHQQSLIDRIQYKCETRGRGAFLPAAPYSLVSQVPYKGSTVGAFSFCMCPGGFIVPSATADGEVVVNGMSPSKRDSIYSNSGIVVAVDQNDFKPFQKEGDLAGLYYQMSIEQKACEVAGKTQKAPTQRLQDFIDRKVSSDLLECSYQPGLSSVEMRDVLPEKVSTVLRDGFKSFGKKMKGYLTNEAQILGVESRTSSPVRIPRDKSSYEHVKIKRLYPCGEGAGYAGGIMSAAIDGEKCVEAFFKAYY